MEVQALGSRDNFYVRRKQPLLLGDTLVRRGHIEDIVGFDEDDWIKHIALGFRYGIPECCIYQWVNDRVVRGMPPGKPALPSARLRRTLQSAFGGVYVACWSCSGPGLPVWPPRELGVTVKTLAGGL